MSELGNIIKHLRGERSQFTLSEETDLCARTIQRAENGSPLALTSLRKLAKHFKLSRNEYAALLLAWLRVEWGDDLDLFEFRVKGSTGGKRLSDADKFLETFRAVPARYQKELMRAAQRKEVLRAIGPINDLYESLKSPSLNQTGTP